MKILIYIIVFFVYSVLKPLVDDAIYNLFSSSVFNSADSVALYCGLCAALFAMSAFLCARWLCKVWDARQAAKAQLDLSTGPDPAPAPESISFKSADEPSSLESSAPEHKHPKSRFCKLCGDPIDPETRRCTGCRKQYFRPPILRKQHLFIGVGVLACIAAAFLMFNLVSQRDAALSQIDELTARISELEDTISEQERQITVYKRNESSYRSQLSSKDDTIENLRQENTTMGYKLDFFNEHIVFIPVDGSNKYHIHGCQYLDLLSYGFYAYNTENAKYQGYKPCPHCCGE